MARPYQAAKTIKSSEITDPRVFAQRRELLRRAAGAAMAAGVPLAAGDVLAEDNVPPAALTLSIDKPAEAWPGSTAEKQTPFEIATSHNNFYELGTDKGDPQRHADKLITDPWSVAIEGHCERPGNFTLEDILKPHGLEERVYRLRCVEAWSMVIPWLGFPLADLLNRFAPTSSAKYVQFQTIMDPERLPGQNSPVLKWPYVEGLRIDEAMHPLTFVAVGQYGRAMPNQSGAPIRLVVPWKYGFKSIKSIVRISFVEDRPDTSWNLAGPREYGFYSNVNPTVAHPRWSQAKERRLDGSSSGLSALFQKKRDTLMFNGYQEEVAGLYTGMDLSKNY